MNIKENIIKTLAGLNTEQEKDQYLKTCEAHGGETADAAREVRCSMEPPTAKSAPMNKAIDTANLETKSEAETE